MLNRRKLIFALGACAFLAPLVASAQEQGKVNRIAVLRIGQPPRSCLEGFLQGLRELGDVEGRDVTIEYGLARSAAQLPEIAADLVGRKIDVLIASGTASILSARNATHTDSLVFIAAFDPVATGLVASLVRPGGDVTGVTAISADIIGKRFRLLND